MDGFSCSGYYMWATIAARVQGCCYFLSGAVMARLRMRLGNQQEGLRRMRKRGLEYVLDRLCKDEFHLHPDRFGELPQILLIRLRKDHPLDSRALRRQYLLFDAAHR